jgi:sulfonate transport system permease protein
MSMSLSAPALRPIRLRLNLAPLLPWLVPVATLALWQVAADAGWITRRTLPSPLGILHAAVTLAASGELFRHALISCQRAFVGFAIGGGLGLAFGVLNGVSSVAAKLTDSTLQMLRNIPHLAIIPMVILWFGIGEPAKLFLVAVGVFFPMYLNTYHGVRLVDAGLVEMGRVYRLTRWAMFFRVILPGAMPSILLGVRYGLGIMWLTLIVAETISASSGIGYMTMNAREFLQTDVVLVGVLLYALLGKLADLAAKALERWCIAWHPSFAAGRED